ncbi:integrase core domain protein [Teladorsagia circumcincta]|uniref:Integrase core domain protein n=1 Tax=Teladorsagia circumcincta TaxID=45464 RepID=A0A2G9UAL4_TELCI|nr:integrase core domain protein [Teladorsagia circumcincta]
MPVDGKPSRDPEVSSTPRPTIAPQSSSRPDEDENVGSQLCILAVDGYRYRHTTCAQLAKNPVKVELQSWPKPVTPWARVHADFAGPLDGNYYLVIVDAYSKWPEIIQMNSITTPATISVLTKVFAQFGNPQTLITDNGSQFTSTTFANFCRRRGIKHVRSPLFHPQSNGQAERFVDTFKRGLAKLKREEPTADALQAFLMTYRSTPCPSGPNNNENLSKNGRKINAGKKPSTPASPCFLSASPKSSEAAGIISAFNAVPGLREHRYMKVILQKWLATTPPPSIRKIRVLTLNRLTTFTITNSKAAFVEKEQICSDQENGTVDDQANGRTELQRIYYIRFARTLSQ